MEKEEMVKLVKDLLQEEAIALLETIVEKLEEEEILEESLRLLDENVHFALSHNL